MEKSHGWTSDMHRQRRLHASQTLTSDKFQGVDVGEFLLRGGDGQIIAADFAILTNAGGKPPDRGVKEEDRFGDPLNEIDPKIVPSNVRQFMSNDGFEHVAGHAGDPRGRHEYHRSPETGGGWFSDLFAAIDLWHLRQTKDVSEASCGLHQQRRRQRARTTNAVKRDEPQHQTKAQGHNTQQPERGDPRLIESD